jgi:hypothetical protein
MLLAFFCAVMDGSLGAIWFGLMAIVLHLGSATW